jgi:hypothetical protein
MQAACILFNENYKAPSALVRLDFVWERVRFGVHIGLHLFALESLKFRVQID